MHNTVFVILAYMNILILWQYYDPHVCIYSPDLFFTSTASVTQSSRFRGTWRRTGPVSGATSTVVHVSLSGELGLRVRWSLKHGHAVLVDDSEAEFRFGSPAPSGGHRQALQLAQTRFGQTHAVLRVRLLEV